MTKPKPAWVTRKPLTAHDRLRDELWIALCMAMQNGDDHVTLTLTLTLTRADAMVLHKERK
jgi:hypothetical protein